MDFYCLELFCMSLEIAFIKLLPSTLINRKTCADAYKVI